MCSHRPYRQAFGVEAALKEINSNGGRLYDKEVVAACTELFQKDKFIFPPDKFTEKKGCKFQVVSCMCE